MAARLGSRVVPQTIENVFFVQEGVVDKCAGMRIALESVGQRLGRAASQIALWAVEQGQKFLLGDIAGIASRVRRYFARP